MLDGNGNLAEELGKGNKQSKSSKGKSTRKQPARRRTMQKQKYIFNQQILEEKAYQDYFDPDPEVEKRLLGLDELVCETPSLFGHTERPGRDTDHLFTATEEEESCIQGDYASCYVCRSGISKCPANPVLPLLSRSPTVSLEVPHPPADADTQGLIPSASQGVSQTQEETQLMMETQPEDPIDLKRQATGSSDEQDKDDGRKTKKVKISIGPPVDLGD